MVYQTEQSFYTGNCDNTREFRHSSQELKGHNEYNQQNESVSFLTKSIQYDLFLLNLRDPQEEGSAGGDMDVK
jgi:hypothetical protein